ncbi:hypothetical protein HAX54_002740, partial [Datura stramonium]|nr:hypothetical protein [Datura stramonium]
MQGQAIGACAPQQPPGTMAYVLRSSSRAIACMTQAACPALACMFKVLRFVLFINLESRSSHRVAWGPAFVLQVQ